MNKNLLGCLMALKQIHALCLIAASDLFDKAWYFAHNTDVPKGKITPYVHYLNHGGFEGRDPGPAFNSSWYLDTYQDVRESRINPLIHYLRYGKKEGRLTHPQANKITNSSHKCPVCQKYVEEFVPLPTFYIESSKKHGSPYTTDDFETINLEQYSCPYCGASDRDRLFACYLDERISQFHAEEKIYLLDIAPSSALSLFIKKFNKINYRTADLFTEGVDFVVDITNMPEVESDSYNILICSHVLEHVSDDKKALSELYRVLKPGGWGIIMVPIVLTIDEIDEDPQVTNTEERWRRFGQDDHVRMYNKSGFIERVELAGFNVSQLGVNYFGESAFDQYGITRKSILYVAEKSK